MSNLSVAQEPLIESRCAYYSAKLFLYSVENSDLSFLVRLGGCSYTQHLR